MVNYLIKKDATHDAITEYDIVILRYVQPDNTNSQQYDDDLVAKLCKIADVYDEGILNDVFIEGVYKFICHSLYHNWETSKADLTDIAF